MTDTYYTVRRETAHCRVDYPQKFATREEAEAYKTEAQRYSLGGTFSIVERQQPRKQTFRF